MCESEAIEDYQIPDHFVLTLPTDAFYKLEVRPDGALRIHQTADQREEFLEFVTEETADGGDR